MKKIFILLVTIICSTLLTNLKAQIYGVPDTLAYLNSIEAKKAQFIGQPFSNLADSLKIQIRFFSPFANISYDKTKETSTTFSFYFAQSIDEHYLSYPRLKISWQPYLNATQSDSLWESNNGGGWTLAVASFYANAIISDIKVVE